MVGRYLIALEEHGADYVHRFVGTEPSGRNFNEMCLTAEGIPHNPMINSGAIMCASLVSAHLPLYQRFEKIMSYWIRLCGYRPALMNTIPVGFDNKTYLSELDSADRNFCLSYLVCMASLRG